MVINTVSTRVIHVPEVQQLYTMYPRSAQAPWGRHKPSHVGCRKGNFITATRGGALSEDGGMVAGREGNAAMLGPCALHTALKLRFGARLHRMALARVLY